MLKDEKGSQSPKSSPRASVQSAASQTASSKHAGAQHGSSQVLDLPQGPLYDILMVDCGSSAFKAPLREALGPRTPIRSQDEQRGKPSIERTSSSSVPTLNILQKSTQVSKATTQGVTGNNLNDIGDNTIKSIIVTHPDKDHYSWISNIIGSKLFEYLILGGAPEKYLNASNEISTLIYANFKRTIFTAVEGNNTPANSLKEGNYSKAQACYPVPEDKISGKLKFNPRFEIKFLAVNSNHVTSLEDNPTTINMSSKEDGTDDYNTDSIIVKITDTITKKSIILTGDATGVTTTRLMDHASKDSNLAALLKANVLVASHHGSSSHGTNNEAWIRTVSPEFIVISTGGSYGHPTKKAFEAFLTSPRLASVISHSVYVGGLSEDAIINYITPRGIFSTLPHGDIKIMFPKTQEEDISIHSANSKTGTFRREVSRSMSSILQAETDQLLKPVLTKTPDPSDIHQKNLEPKSYKQLLLDAKESNNFIPIEIDLNDHRNEFIFDYLISSENLDEQTMESTEVFLSPTASPLIGQIMIKGPQKTKMKHSLQINLKDPRNIHLLRQIKFVASSSPRKESIPLAGEDAIASPRLSATHPHQDTAKGHTGATAQHWKEDSQ